MPSEQRTANGQKAPKKGAIIDLMSASIRAKRAERQHKATQDREEREWSALSWYHAGKLSGNALKFQNLSSIDFVLLDNSAILSASSWFAKLKDPAVCAHEHPVHICQCFCCLFVNVQTSHSFPNDNEATYRFSTIQYSLKLMCSYILISNSPDLIYFETYMLVMQESVLLAGRRWATHERWSELLFSSH